MQFNFNEFLAQEKIQKELRDFLAVEKGMEDFIERFDIHRGKISIQICGNEDIEYGLMKWIHEFFPRYDIDIIQYDLNCRTTLQDDIYITDIILTIEEAHN